MQDVVDHEFLIPCCRAKSIPCSELASREITLSIFWTEHRQGYGSHHQWTDRSACAIREVPFHFGRDLMSRHVQRARDQGQHTNQPAPFIEKAQKEIKKRNFAGILCDNTGIRSITKNVPLNPSSSNPRVDCRTASKGYNLSKINLVKELNQHSYLILPDTCIQIIIFCIYLCSTCSYFISSSVLAQIEGSLCWRW